MLDELLKTSLSHNLIVVLLAMLPINELRGTLPLAVHVLNMPWYQAFYLCIIGNLIPVPFLLLFFGAGSRLVQKVPIGKRFVDWLLTRTAKKTARFGKYKFSGLLVFVAIPLPLTGAWTASLAAYILGMRFWPAFLSIALGVLGAGIIVTALTLLGWIGAGIALVALIVIVGLGAWKA
ncbi:MAG TPA: small multi-drug export protein [Dehalococcoidales bacterium]|nr:small multi-drug export protein [Dehalococcoidales bacterium]